MTKSPRFAEPHGSLLMQPDHRMKSAVPSVISPFSSMAKSAILSPLMSPSTMALSLAVPAWVLLEPVKLALDAGEGGALRGEERKFGHCPPPPHWRRWSKRRCRRGGAESQ